MSDQPHRQDSPSTTEMLTLLGRIDERTRNQAENAIETRNAIADINKQLAALDVKYPTRREMNLLKWVIGILAGALAAGAIGLLIKAAGGP